MIDNTTVRNKNIYDLNFDIDKYTDTKDKNILLEKNDLNFSKKGIYVAEHHWNGVGDSSENLIKKVTSEDHDWTTIESMYRYPNLSLSRDKLTLLKDKYGTKVVRNPDKADVCVISTKTIEKLISSDMYYGGTWTVKTFIDKKMPELKAVMTDEAYEYLDGILCHLHDDSYIFGGDRYNSWNNSDEFIDSALSYFTRDSNGWKSKSDSNGALYISNDNIDDWKNLNDSSKIFVTDVYVNQVCSEDSIILDWEQYENIKKMLGATNEDRSVAMTLMANCKIEESKTVLGLLFYHYGDSIKGTNTWNQVAFKTLRKQFDHYMIGGWNGAHTSTFSQLIQKLAEDDALTEESMKHICELVFDKVLMSGCGFSQDNCAFEMKLEDVRLTQKYKDKLIKEEKTLSELVTAGSDLPF